MRKKLKKKAKTNPAILNNTLQVNKDKFNTNDLALLAGLTSLSSLILGMLGIGPFALLSLIIAPIAVFIGIARLESGKPRKSKAIWGLVLGLLISGLWIWAYNFF